MLVVKRGSETVTVEATLASAPAVELSLAGRGISFVYDGKAWELRSLNEQSPLYTAGLRQGDKLTQFDGKAYDPAGLVAYLNSLDSQASVKVTVERDSKTQDISVPVEALKAFGAFSFRGDFGRSFDRFDRRGMPFGMLPNRSYLGVQFLTLDENVAKERNLTQTEGALITEVQKDSPAEKAGLKVNDIITAVEGDKVDARRDLRERLFAYESGDKVKLDIIRDGKTSQLEVTLERAALGRGMLPMFRFGPRGFRFFGPGMSDLPDLPFELQQPAAPAAAPQGPSL
jgi:S1-C subfamily serine protease